MIPVVEIHLSGNCVKAVKNNVACEGYDKAKVAIGDRLGPNLIALFLMNPHRFKVVRL